MSHCEEHAELNAALDKALDRITSSFDRVEEAHHWIHLMEQNYHIADPFRWSLSAFIRALKEIPQLIAMELQNEEGFSDWFRPLRKEMESDPLIKSFAKMRDGIVHQKMLLPNSECNVGVTEFRGLKLGMKLNFDPRLDSLLVMHQYIFATRDDDNADFLGILIDDEDSIPCVQRVWRFTAFPDDEIIDLCSKAWLRMGQLVEDVIRWLGATPPPRNLKCRHGTQKIQFKLFERKKLQEEREQMRLEYPKTNIE